MANLPNFLTISRICIIPIIVALLFFPGKNFSLAAAILFTFAAITDWLDGFIARKQSMETTLGKFLDPLADKLLIVTALIMLIPSRGIPAWIVAIIVGREMAVTGLRGIAALEGLTITSSNLAKSKTTFQIIALIGLILHYHYFGINFHVVGSLFLWIALIVTTWSGIGYFVKFCREKKFFKDSSCL